MNARIERVACERGGRVTDAINCPRQRIVLWHGLTRVHDAPFNTTCAECGVRRGVGPMGEVTTCPKGGQSSIT